MVVQGRELSGEDIGQVQGLLAEHPEWRRTRLSEELCRRWDWRNALGRPMDMAARTLPLKLDYHSPGPPHHSGRKPGVSGPDGAAWKCVGWLRRPRQLTWLYSPKMTPGPPVYAMETFVDRERFRGACYRAANWLRLGAQRP